MTSCSDTITRLLVLELMLVQHAQREFSPLDALEFLCLTILLAKCALFPFNRYLEIEISVLNLKVHMLRLQILWNSIRSCSHWTSKRWGSLYFEIGKFCVKIGL